MRRLILTLPTPPENVALDEALLDWAEDEAGRGREPFATGDRKGVGSLLRLETLPPEESNQSQKRPDPVRGVANDSRPPARSGDEGAEWEFLRLWESPQPVVVVGRSSRIHEEVNEMACAERGIPILRRSSGGAAIVAGPGCLMYALVLSYALRPELRDIRRAHAYVLGRLAESLRSLARPVAHAGTSDLVITDVVTGGSPVLDNAGEPPALHRKFSGNSLRAKRTHLVYHGTLLYDFELPLITRCLHMPPRQPDYRAARSHLDFVTNLPLPREAIVEALFAAWPTTSELAAWPHARVTRLVAEQYSQDHWNREFE